MPMKLRKTPATKLVRGTGARYAAPALEKGLDVIELLARETDGLTLNEIARLLDRTSSELFRMVNALCRRGYIGQHDDRYVLTLKLFELAHRHKPIKSLTVSPFVPPALVRQLPVYRGARSSARAARSSAMSSLLLTKVW